MGYLLGEEFANGAEAIGVEEEERWEELGEEDGVFGGKFVAELAQRFELGGDVDGQLGGVHETRELFTGSRRHAHCFSDHD